MARLRQARGVAAYFAYGSNLLRARLEQRVGLVSGPPTAAYASGYALRFHKRGSDGSGKADAFAAAGEAIPGGVYHLSETQIERLDRFELGYARTRLAVRDQRGVVIEAWAFLADAESVDPSLRPFDWYLALAIAGAASLGLPQRHIEALRAHPAYSDPDQARAKRHWRLATAAGYKRGAHDFRSEA